jgi:hypothetical protein
MKHLIRAFMIGILKTAEPTPVKRDYRHVGIPRIPDDDKRTYKALSGLRCGKSV